MCTDSEVGPHADHVDGRKHHRQGIFQEHCQREDKQNHRNHELASSIGDVVVELSDAVNDEGFIFQGCRILLKKTVSCF